MDTNTHQAEQPHIDEKRALELFEEAKTELQSLARDDLEPVRIDLLRAVYTSVQVSKTAQADKPLFDRTFRESPAGMVDRLERDAFVLWSAETQYRRLETEERGTERRPPTELLEQCREGRQQLLEAAAYVFRRDDALRALLSDIRRGSGYLDLADDLKRLAELFTAHWPEAEGRSDVVRADVDRAAALASRLLDTIATPLAKQVSTWADMRVRAWTRLARTYEELRAAAAYVHRHDPARLAQYPSLFTFPRKRSS